MGSAALSYRKFVTWKGIEELASKSEAKNHRGGVEKDRRGTIIDPNLKVKKKEGDKIKHAAPILLAWGLRRSRKTKKELHEDKPRWGTKVSKF